MKRKVSRLQLTGVFLTAYFALSVGAFTTELLGKEKTPPIDPNDVTFRLFQFLDANRGGKLADFYILADVYRSPKNPSEELQRVLRADYDKNRGFAKLNLYVRSVGKIAPEQMQSYSSKDFYEFGLVDLEKFMKTEPGPFGKPGDVYLQAIEDGPLAGVPVTDEVRKAYEFYLSEYVLPALQKK